MRSSAPTKKMTSAWIMVERFSASSGSKTVGSSWRDDVPTWSAPKSSAASRMPTALLRPSSATAMPVNPRRLVSKSLMSTSYRQPSRSTPPARPGERARDRHGEEVVPPHGDPRVGGGVRVEADRAHLVAERRPVEEHVVDDERGERDEDAGVQGLDAAPDLPDLADSKISPERGIDGCDPCRGPPARRGTSRRRSRSSSA